MNSLMMLEGIRMKKSTLKLRQARLATATQEINRQVNKEMALLQKQLADQILENKELKQELAKVKEELHKAFTAYKKHVHQKAAAQQVIKKFKIASIKAAGGYEKFAKSPQAMQLKAAMHIGGMFDDVNFGCRNTDANRGMAGAFNRLETEHPGLYNELASYVAEEKITWKEIGQKFAALYFEDRNAEDRFFDYATDLNWTYENGYTAFIKNLRNVVGVSSEF